MTIYLPPCFEELGLETNSNLIDFKILLGYNKKDVL